MDSFDSSGLNAALGWTSWDEFQCVSALAPHGAWVHASDWSTNLVVHANLPPASAPVAERTATEVAEHEAVHTVAFVMSDGDNLCWLQGGWKDAAWFGDPARLNPNESVPLGWTFSPAADAPLPDVLQWAQSQATANDSFIAGPSGAGYTYPGLLPDDLKSGFAQATAAMMVDASMSVLNIIGAAPSQESIEHLTSVEGVGALVYYTYLAGYSGLRGAISYLNGTLVIGGRVSLWGDDSFSTGDETMLGVQGVADLLSTLPKDPTSPLSYSIIPVNAWSHNYSDVVATSRLLEAAGGFKVVSPELLVQLLAANTNASESCPLASGSWSESCLDCTISGNGTCILSCGDCSGMAAACDLAVCHEGLSVDGSSFVCQDGRTCPAAAVSTAEGP